MHNGGPQSRPPVGIPTCRLLGKHLGRILKGLEFECVAGRVEQEHRGLLANLRSSKEQGQSNFDNPGIQLLGVGADFDVTPQSRISTNINELWFSDTEILKAARATADVGRNIGTDVSVAWIWRPYNTQNMILRVSAATLLPGQGLKDLFGEDTKYYSVLGNLILTY